MEGVVSLNHERHLLMCLPYLHLFFLHPRGKRKDLLKGGGGFPEVWNLSLTEAVSGFRAKFLQGRDHWDSN